MNFVNDTLTGRRGGEQVVYSLRNSSALEHTAFQFDEIMHRCRSLFEAKTRDYGTAWRIMRLSSLTDQLFIKARRIRNLEEVGHRKVDEGVEPEYIGLINYSLMALIQMEMDENAPIELEPEDVMAHYDEHLSRVKGLLERKNHDYGEAWRDMRVSSITDLILMKILRIKQIEDNEGKTTVSEGLEAHYMDIIIYSAFALIKLQERS